MNDDEDLDLKLFDFADNDFIIRIRPSEEDGKWTGDINLTILNGSNFNLKEESYAELMHFCKMVCSTVPMMEEDEDFREYVSDYVSENIDGQHFNPVLKEDTPSVTKEGDNVIRLHFGTRTKGNA
ncbi:MAG: hypothetical protein VW496_03500 [Pelagibacteraceae bacterium]